MNRTAYIPVTHDDFWTHDAPLFVGTFPYYQSDPRMVQARLHVSEECFIDRQVRNIRSMTEDMHMPKLWKAFEQWLYQQFPEATRIATPFNDPIANSIEEYQTFLRTLGYTPIAQAAFGKAIEK